MKTPPDCPPQKISEKIGLILDKVFINLAGYAIIGVFICIALAICVKIIKWAFGI